MIVNNLSTVQTIMQPSSYPISLQYRNKSNALSFTVPSFLLTTFDGNPVSTHYFYEKSWLKYWVSKFINTFAPLHTFLLGAFFKVVNIKKYKFELANQNIDTVFEFNVKDGRCVRRNFGIWRHQV